MDEANIVQNKMKLSKIYKEILILFNSFSRRIYAIYGISKKIKFAHSNEKSSFKTAKLRAP